MQTFRRTLLFALCASTVTAWSAPLLFDQNQFLKQAKTQFAMHGTHAAGQVVFQEILQPTNHLPATFENLSQLIVLSAPSFALPGSQGVQLAYFIDFAGRSGFAWAKSSRGQIYLSPTLDLTVILHKFVTPQRRDQMKQSLIAQIPGLTIESLDWMNTLVIQSQNPAEVIQAAQALRQKQFSSLIEEVDMENQMYIPEFTPLHAAAIPLPKQGAPVDLAAFSDPSFSHLTVDPFTWPPAALKNSPDCQLFLQSQKP